MILADLHVHTNFSSDSSASVESQVEKGIMLGFKTICITDHYDMDYPSRIEGPEYQLDVENYTKKLRQIKKIYKEKIEVLIGVELGLMPRLKERISDFVKIHEFDFLIGSSHLVNEKDPYFKSFYENRDEKEAYREYFESILENTKIFDEYSVYGHLDYVVRYGPNKNKYFDFEYYQEIFEEILRNIIKNGKGIEVNTSGFIRGLGSMHPCQEILKLYRALGGEIITFGSDAHEPKNIGYKFDLTKNILESLGFKYYTIFRNKVPFFYNI